MEGTTSLRDLITSIARERGLSLAYDTHYDANNWELCWWQGNTFCSVDVQPYPDGRIDISALQTIYPLFPRLLAWAWQSIPMFPTLGHTQREALGTVTWPCPPDQLRELIGRGLPPNNSFKPNPLRGSA